MRHLFTSFGFGALALGLVVSGCNSSGGQTGDLSGQNGGGGPATGETFGGCDENREKLAGFDTETDAGTAEALLAYAEKTFDAPITWKTAPEGQAWSLEPESGEGQLHITVTRGDHAYQLTYTQPKSSNGQEAGPALGSLCPEPQLGVDAHVDVTTDGGALAESFDTVLRSNEAGVATFRLPLDLTKLGGSLAATSSNPKSKLVQLSLAATLTPEGTTGSISAMEQTDGGAVASAAGAQLAVWPGAAACESSSKDGTGLEMPLETSVLGATGTDTVESIALSKAVDVTWLDGTRTKLTLTVESMGAGCFSMRDDVPVPVGGGPGVSYPIHITLKTDDGRLDGAYDGTVVASTGGGERRIEARADFEVPVARVGESGFSDVSIPSGSDTVSVAFEAHRNDQSAAGSISLFAIANPPCLTDPAPPMSSPGMGASVPGCEGQSLTRVENAYWSY